MSAALFLIIGLSLAALGFWWPHYRLRQAVARPFPRAWSEILERNLPLYRRMDQPLQQQLQRLIKQFLHQKRFFGCAGQAITEEIRVTIAAQACLLLLNRPTDVYGKLRFILVYPRAFVARHTQYSEAGVESEHAAVLQGESWDSGKVILSWDDIQHDVRNFSDGRNVILHEFAHQLDEEDGASNGAPLLQSSSGYRSWARVLTREYDALQESVALGREGLLDHYGATSPAEFFAVITEAFFEQPGLLNELHPELYAQLQAFYRIDPSQWQ